MYSGQTRASTLGARGCQVIAKKPRLIPAPRVEAVDTVGAGEGEIVLCVQGSSARFTPETKQLPIDAAVIGIVDRVQVGPNTVFSARATSSRT